MSIPKNNSIERIIADLEKFFNKDKDISFTEISDDEKKSILTEQEGVFSGNVDYIPLNYFYSNGKLIKELTQFSSFFGGTEILHLTEEGAVGEDVIFMVGDIKGPIPWALTLMGHIEYDSEIYGNYSFFIGNKKSILDDIKKKTISNLIEAFNDFNDQSKKAMAILNTYFPDKQKEKKEDLIRYFLKTDVGKEIFPLIEKNNLNESLPTRSTQSKTKKTL